MYHRPRSVLDKHNRGKLPKDKRLRHTVSDWYKKQPEEFTERVPSFVFYKVLFTFFHLMCKSCIMEGVAYTLPFPIGRFYIKKFKMLPRASYINYNHNLANETQNEVITTHDDSHTEGYKVRYFWKRGFKVTNTIDWRLTKAFSASGFKPVRNKTRMLSNLIKTHNLISKYR